MEPPLTQPVPERRGIGSEFRRRIKSKRTYRVLAVVLFAWLFPLFVAFYLACGLIDVMRNTRRDKTLFRKYFAGNGTVTWAVSPINLLLDLLALPIINRGVWKLEDLPRAQRDELVGLLETIDGMNLVDRLQGELADNKREMIFWKWTGRNLDAPIDIPQFHRSFRTIATIGVSTFNARHSTSWHFGVFRTMTRVLYNLNPSDSDGAWIQVGKVRHYWKDDPLFIFDDTLFHQSVNDTDEKRYCAFIDIIRPSLIPAVMKAIVTLQGAILLKVRRVFYNGWSFIE